MVIPLTAARDCPVGLLQGAWKRTKAVVVLALLATALHQRADLVLVVSVRFRSSWHDGPAPQELLVAGRRERTERLCRTSGGHLP